MRLSFSDIAIHWLRDRHRLEERWVHVNDEEGRSQLPAFRDRLTFVLDRIMVKERIDDINALVDDFLTLNPGLPDWWDAAMRHRGIHVRFEDREPIVAIHSYLEWKYLADRLDIDGLVALAYARSYSGLPGREALDQWGVYPVAEDRWVRRTLGHERHRLFDLHTHLEGCENAPYLWQKVVEGILQRRHLPEYSRSRQQRLRQGAGRDELEDELELVFERAVRQFRSLERMHEQRWGAVEPAGSQINAPSIVSDHLWRERVILIRSWQALAQAGRGRERSRWDGHQRQIATALDTYLYGKQRFIARQVQTSGSNPGLANFRRFFDRMKITHVARSPRRVWKRRFRLISSALESPRLNGVELRIAALDKPSDYVRFFRKWQADGGAELERRLPVRDHRPHVAFVVHFIRWRPDLARVYDPTVQAERLVHRADRLGDRGVRSVLDRQTAALHRFRWEHPELARHVVGIDVANVERLNPVATFTPYLRLLRGLGLGPLSSRPQTPVDLDERLGFDHSPYMRAWRRLRDQGRLAPTHDLPRLGLTYHAGEDYFHPLDGVRSVWEVLRRLKAHEGDRIGHGLALGDDPARFARVYANGGTVPQGELLETLAWAHRRLGALPGVDNRAMRVIEDEITGLSGRIYGRAFPIGVLQKVQQLKHRPYLPANADGVWFSDAGPEERWVYDADAADEQVRNRRALHVGLPQLYFDPLTIRELDKIVGEVLGQLVRQKVIMEVNPTSNLCVGGLDCYSDHPIFRIIKRNDRVKFVICCDDPGTFATRIENEYAAMIDAVKDLDIADQDAARRAIEGAVITAQEAAFHERW